MTTDASRRSRPSPRSRPHVRGKFLHAAEGRLDVRGFTYGPFRPSGSGAPFPPPARAHADLAAIAAAGGNAIRVYTVPPIWLLDAAELHGLRVLVGIPWEQHVAFLDEPGLADSIERRVRRAVRRCGGHPSVLAYAVGNEIPAPIVRWTGQRRIERHIERLCRAVKDEDPGALATYVNYPSTEYLELEGLDFVSFNVYLESVDRLTAYIKRLHNLAGDRPLLMGEVGLDSGTHGEDAQARGLGAQLRAARRGGCAGSFVFSWTDEWHAGGQDITEWRFGVTDREREPKPALESVRRAFVADTWQGESRPPRISVVVCAYNAADTLRDCLEGATCIDYPDYEVIVVDDGSSDATADIAASFDVTLIRTPNRGLSHARNTGLEASSGAIVAYTDADARPDRDWLTHLAIAFEETDHAGIGGPNVAPGGDGWVADCVARAPGGPIHVLLSDDEAEHIPGCNMAFRREALERIDGFDPRFRVAGDDVDVCWRIQAAGMTLGFSPGAVVWHHPRDSVRAYWRQQAGYGRAEALLEEKWPEKYNTAGHVTWGGRVYRRPHGGFLPRHRIYHGVWGSAPFQSAEPGGPTPVESLATTPEWYLVLAGLLVLGLVGVSWAPLRLAYPLLALAAIPLLARAAHAALHARFEDEGERGADGSGPPPDAARAADASGPAANPPRSGTLRRRLVIGLLHVLQPAARLRGRLRYGLTPWRVRSARRFVWPGVRTVYVWSESWRAPAAWISELDAALRLMRATVLCGGPFDRWDLYVKSGLSGRVRVYTCTEEHGGGRQFVRFRFVPRLSRPAVGALLVLIGLGGWALVDGAAFAATLLLLLAGVLVARVGLECGAVMSASLQAAGEIEATDLRRLRRRLAGSAAPSAARAAERDAGAAERAAGAVGPSHPAGEAVDAHDRPTDIAALPRAAGGAVR